MKFRSARHVEMKSKLVFKMVQNAGGGVKRKLGARGVAAILGDFAWSRIASEELLNAEIAKKGR
jgi:hypothetical protein